MLNPLNQRVIRDCLPGGMTNPHWYGPRRRYIFLSLALRDDAVGIWLGFDFS